MTEDAEPIAINIRSTRYFIARAAARCAICGRSSAVFGIGVPPGHEVLSDEDEWAVEAQGAFLFFIEYLPPSVCRHLAQLSNSYRPARGREDADSRWVNHCTTCDVAFNDEELFCEPEGAFLPLSAAHAADVHVLWIEEHIEAVVGGFADEPQFFDVMSRR